MRTLPIAVACLICLLQPVAFGHGSHSVSKDEAITIVHESVPKLSDKDYGFEVGQLDPSWKTLSKSDVTMIETDGDFYVMSATNSETNAVIYLLIGLNGRILHVKNTNDF